MFPEREQLDICSAMARQRIAYGKLKITRGGP
jgi:hypothetical protein